MSAALSRLGAAAGEDDLVGALGVDALGDRLARLLDGTVGVAAQARRASSRCRTSPRRTAASPRARARRRGWLLRSRSTWSSRSVSPSRVRRRAGRTCLVYPQVRRASSDAKTSLSALVAVAHTGAAAQVPLLTQPASRPLSQTLACSGPSSASTTSSTVISAGSRVRTKPPLAPRTALTMPARRSATKSCSRKRGGIARRSAISRALTGPSP